MSAFDRSLEEAGGAPNVRRGMLLMIAGLALFSVLNGLVKFLAETFPVNQIIFFRNFSALATLLAMAPALGGLKALRVTNQGGLALQAVQFTGVLGFIFLAYRYMPLADATAISFLQPLLVVLLSAPFLGERVTRVGWIGVILGFAGVALMMRPTGAASAFGVSMALIGTVFSALSLLQQRNLSRGATSIAIAFWTLGGSALLIAPTLPFGWVTPTPSQWAWLIGNGLASGACQYLTTRALYHAPVGAIAPLNYTKMVWAVLVGFLWFGEVPTFGMLAGSATVIFASFIVYRDQK
ncbi:MAG: DMT family transporter [Alphaproteobacteria bacterium]|nr:DMT family transporter [Alphaproteobacteria bacterium]